MRYSYNLPFIDKYQLLSWAKGFDNFMFQDAHRDVDPLYKSSFDFRLAVDSICSLEVSDNAFHELSLFLDEPKNDWVFGGLSYDLKNELEELYSRNSDKHGLAEMLFFVPKYIFQCIDGLLTLQSTVSLDIQVFIDQIKAAEIVFEELENVKVNASLNQTDYVQKIKEIQEKIQSGEIYEMNFCQNFFVEDIHLEPLSLFHKLNENSKAPFSTFFRFNDFYLLSASPERYLHKNGDKLISQPIKGTRKRGHNNSEDASLREELRISQKDQIENVMIVDLVRNDLSRVASKSSVEVTDLFGVYSFPHVHQMISTIECRLDENKDFLDAIKCSYPMGSMTGAPKIRSMKLIERFEDFKRSFYSGSVGYFTPERDFDFNVVIRSLLYSDELNYLSFPVGGAITIDSSPEGEYEECVIKIQGVLKALNADLF